MSLTIKLSSLLGIVLQMQAQTVGPALANNIRSTDAPVSNAAISPDGHVAIVTSNVNRTKATIRVRSEVLLFRPADSQPTRRVVLIEREVSTAVYTRWIGVTMQHPITFAEDGRTILVADGFNKLLRLDAITLDYKSALAIDERDIAPVNAVIDIRVKDRKIAVLMQRRPDQWAGGLVAIYDWTDWAAGARWTLEQCWPRQLDWAPTSQIIVAACVEPSLSYTTSRFGADLYVIDPAHENSVRPLNSGGRAGSIAVVNDGSIWSVHNEDPRNGSIRIVEINSTSRATLRSKFGSAYSIHSNGTLAVSYAEKSRITFSWRELEADLKVTFQGFLIWRTADRVLLFQSPPFVPTQDPTDFRVRINDSGTFVLTWFESFPGFRVFDVGPVTHSNANRTRRVPQSILPLD